MTGRRVRAFVAALLSWLVVGLLWWTTPAAADHSPAGSGGCTQHTLTCYPQCRWEWTGGTSVAAPDTGPCPMPPDYTTKTAEQSWPATSNVAVTNWPTSSNVAVSNFPSSVTVDKGAGWPNGDPSIPATEVRVINSADDPIPSQPDNTTRQALAVVVLCAVAYFVAKVALS